MLQGDPVPGLAGVNFGSATSAPAINSSNNVAFWNRFSVSEGALYSNAGGMHVVVKGIDCADAAMPLGCPADLNADGFVDDASCLLWGTTS